MRRESTEPATVRFHHPVWRCFAVGTALTIAMSIALFTTSTRPGMAAEARAFISVRAIPEIPKAAKMFLAEVAEDRMVLVPAGKSGTQVTEQLCGSVDADYIEILRSRNELPVDVAADADRDIYFPACFYIKLRPVVIVPADSNLSKIAAARSGVAGSRTLNDIIDLNPGLLKASPRAAQSDRSRSAKTLDVPRTRPLQPGESLNLSFETVPVRYALRPDLQMSADDVVARLRSIFADSATTITLLRASSGSAEVHHVSVPPAGPDACGGPSPLPNATDIVAALERSITGMQGRREPKTVVIGVLDSGIDKSLMAETWFARSDQEQDGIDGIDDDGNDFIDDVIGANIHKKNEKSEPFAFPLYDRGGAGAEHGTHVSALALGGPDLIAQRGANRLLESVKLLIANAVQETIEPGEDMSPQPRYGIPTGSLADGLAYLTERRDPKASIVNVSLGASELPSSMQAKMVSFHNAETLLVVSAGNDSQRNIDHARIWPAAAGGQALHAYDPSARVITVAAHDGNYDLAGFSNWGVQFVDLAAPGCDIRSYGLRDPGSQPGTAHPQIALSGTSQAAPLVAFTAALIRAQGLHSPVAIKSRIIATVDVRPNLRGRISSGGTLNVVRAISLYHDVIQTTSTAPPLYGRLALNPKDTIACGDSPSLKWGQVIRVRRNAVGTGIEVLASREDGTIDIRKCAALPGSVQFDRGAGGSPVPLKWAEISDATLAPFRK